MNNEELKVRLTRINQIQHTAFERTLTTLERTEFKRETRILNENGYKMKRRRVRDTFGNVVGVIWNAIPVSEVKRNSECEFVYTDVRPKDRCTLKGDCTTRCMTFMLNGRMTYDQIERRQYELAAIHHTRRNTTCTWEKVLFENGYVRVNINGGRVRRSLLARILRGSFSCPIATLSSGHVAAVDNDGVHDTWDSRGGRCKAVYVIKADLPNVVATLEGWNIHTSQAVQMAA